MKINPSAGADKIPDYGAKMPQHEIETLTYLFLPKMQKYFASEEGKCEYEEWEREQAETTRTG